MDMRTYRVTTPVPGHTGEVGGVFFVKGEAVVEAPAPLDPLGYEPLPHADRLARDAVEQHDGYRALAYFRQAGYHVEDVTPDAEAEAEADEPTGDVPPPARNASTEEWRAYMVGSGRLSADDANQLGRDQLVERYEKGASA